MCSDKDVKMDHLSSSKTYMGEPTGQPHPREPRGEPHLGELTCRLATLHPLFQKEQSFRPTCKSTLIIRTHIVSQTNGKWLLLKMDIRRFQVWLFYSVFVFWALVSYICGFHSLCLIIVVKIFSLKAISVEAVMDWGVSFKEVTHNNSQLLMNTSLDQI